MRQKEQRLYDTFKRQMLDVRHFMHERVENMLDDGFPDLFCRNIFTTFMIELKAVVSYPAKKETRVLGAEGLSQGQKNWMLEYTKLGGAAFILIRVGVGNNADHYLIHGWQYDFVNEFTREELNLNAVAIGWKNIKNFLEIVK